MTSLSDLSIAYVKGEYRMLSSGEKKASKMYILFSDSTFFLTCADIDNDDIYSETNCYRYETVAEVLLYAWWEFKIPPNKWNIIEFDRGDMILAHQNSIKRLVNRYKELAEIDRVVYKSEQATESDRLFYISNESEN